MIAASGSVMDAIPRTATGWPPPAASAAFVPSGAAEGYVRPALTPARSRSMLAVRFLATMCTAIPLAAAFGGSAEFPIGMQLAETEHGDAAVSMAELTSRNSVPRSALKLYERALRADQKGRTVEAMAHLAAVINAAPEFFPAHAALAIGYLKIGNLDEAARHLQTALTHDPFYLPGKELYGVLLFARGEFGESAEILKELVKSAPCRKTAHYYLSEALRALGDEEGARRYLATARELARRRKGALPGMAERVHSLLPWR